MDQSNSQFILKIGHHNMYWFNIRRVIFQVILPILLAIMTVFDYASQSGSMTFAYDHLYFYTAIIIFFHRSAILILKFIFDKSSIKIIFKKEIDSLSLPGQYNSFSKPHNNNTSNIESNNIESNSFGIYIQKKIYKIRYTNNRLFRYMNETCWFLGIESPMLIPPMIISKLSNTREEVTEETEDAIFKMVLINLYNYNPKKYNVVPMIDDDIIDINENLFEENFVPKIIISDTDRIICQLQTELFGKQFLAE